MSSIPDFYYDDGSGQVCGPFSLTALQQMRQQCILPPEVLVCPQGEQNWRPLSELISEAVAAQEASRPRPKRGRKSRKPRSRYQRVAERVGMIPDFNLKRNLLQLAIVLPVVIIFAAWGYLRGGSDDAIMWGLGGFLLGGMASGAVLMVMGWRKDPPSEDPEQ